MVLGLQENGNFGENGTGKLYVSTDYDGSTYDDGDGTNEETIVASIEADNTFSDVGYFENYAQTITQGDERVINTDYCGAGNIVKKADRIAGFNVDIQEILDMENLALILGAKLNTSTNNGVETITMKRVKTAPYLLFKFVTCPKNGKYNVHYFVKAALSGDIEIPETNLNKNEFVGVTLDFQNAKGGNHIIQKGVSVDVTP